MYRITLIICIYHSIMCIVNSCLNGLSLIKVISFFFSCPFSSLFLSLVGLKSLSGGFTSVGCHWAGLFMPVVTIINVWSLKRSKKTEHPLSQYMNEIYWCTQTCCRENLTYLPDLCTTALTQLGEAWICCHSDGGGIKSILLQPSWGVPFKLQFQDWICVACDHFSFIGLSLQFHFS